ncbi:hypothetical protein FKO01_17800 [Mesorhizobium sp. B2-3-3]|nr:hypothetical protein FKO01_17800 [Mesorhizobium sp. B2-3-3]
MSVPFVVCGGHPRVSSPRASVCSVGVHASVPSPSLQTRTVRRVGSAASGTFMPAATPVRRYRNAGGTPRRWHTGPPRNCTGWGW